VLSLNNNKIKKIQNIDGLQLEELYLSQNQLTKITGLAKLPNLRTLDLSKNQIVLLRGLENIDSLRFLNLSLNRIAKIRQLAYVENLNLLTELDMCFNLI
jgi:internalin A